MDIISLKGTEDKLYELVARLVMSPAVLRQNNNYPFKTTPQYTWHIALDGNTVVGFIPVKSTDTGPYIDNYYIKGDEPAVLDGLLEHVISHADKCVTAMVHNRHVDYYRRHGFISCKEWTKYNKMERPKTKGGGVS